MQYLSFNKKGQRNIVLGSGEREFDLVVFTNKCYNDLKSTGFLFPDECSDPVIHSKRATSSLVSLLASVG